LRRQFSNFMIYRNSERGSVLLEFSLVALVLSLLLATTIDFGRLMFSAQQIQDVARVAARELAVTPLPADIPFDGPGGALTYQNALTGVDVPLRIYNPDFLVVNVDVHPDVQDYFADKPLVNKALLPLMIHDHPSGLPNLLRFPGALVTSATAESGYTVAIPLVDSRGTDGVETIRWIPIIEEIRKASDADCPARGPFSLSYDPSTDPCGPGTPADQRGLVAIRINYPYQAAAMTGFRTNPAGPFEPNISNPIHAEDEAVAQINPEKLPGALVGDPGDTGAYAGQFGLGRQLAFALPGGVRPFRKLLAAQAIYRREVFQ
jgi:hypothetical protein